MLTKKEVLLQARTCLGKYCKGCEICDGRACRNQIPGPGAKQLREVEGDPCADGYALFKSPG